MGARISSAVERALKLIERGATLREAAAKAGCNLSSITRARKRMKLPKRKAGRPVAQA